MAHQRWNRIFSAFLLAGMVLSLVAPAGTVRAAPSSSDRTESAGKAQQPAALTPEVSPPVSPAKTAGLPPIQSDIPNIDEKQPTKEIPVLGMPKVEAEAKAEPDSAVQTDKGPLAMPSPILNFEGVNNLDGVYPPDTDGEIGKDHYVQMVNLHTAVYDKSGTLLYGPFTPNLIWPTGDACRNTNDGDVVAIYDQFADRWLLTQFGFPNYPSGPYYQCIAVSKTGTPTNNPSDWWPYTFIVSTTKMNDYPKIAVWPDGYYMTANQFTGGASWGGAGVWVFDRTKMLAGQAATFQYFDLYGVNSNYGGMLPVDVEGPTPPPAGAPAYFLEVDDSSWIPSVDAMRVWQFHVDWANPANTTFGLAGEPNATLPVDNFNLLPCTVSGSRSCIPQQGTSVKLDAIGDRLMFHAAYRNYGDHDSVVVNHTVLADGTDRAGVRWYEIRNVGSAPTIYQQGTYAPADGNHRWMASMSMDHVGNMALGYSVSGSTMYPSIRYTGRLASDPLGQMAQGETSVIEGTGYQSGSGSRWGDYSAMSVDPVDDCTFWYTQEYIQTNGTANWQTRIASFKFPNCSLGPQGTLTGNVSDSGTSAGIAGATVQAVASITQTATTTTNGDGDYQVNLLVGTYDVTASAYGYMPQTFTGVQITENNTTVQDFALDPATSYTVSGVVTDATTGWPLYAKIVIDGFPGGPIFTDPATGAYSVSLVAGTTYTFNVTAWVSGYQGASVSVGPLTGDLTQNIELDADLTSCTAPGYVLNVTGVYEQFEGATFPPAGWTVANNGGNCSWVGNDPGSRGNLTGATGNFAIADSDICGSGTTMNTDLYSPVMDVSSLANLFLSFNYDYYNLSSGEVAAVDVSANGGSTWTNLFSWNSSHRGPAEFVQDVTPLLGGSTQAQLRFHYVAPGWDWWWEVDNVFMGEKVCTPMEGGIVSGVVKDANSNVGLVGATVENDAGGSTTTVANPTDPAIGDGFYTMFSPSGPHVFTASMDNYSPATATVDVPLGGGVRQDFALQTGHLTYTPAAIDETLQGGSSTTVPVTLTNIGGGDANFEILELDKGAVPFGPFEEPNIVVKPFKQGYPSARGLGLTNPPDAAPLAAGDVIQTWPATGVAGPWGIAFDGADDSVWVSSPAPAWNGSDKIVEFTPTGTPTGRFQPYSWSHTNGPADAAFNWNTGKLWVMNVNTGVANCIYEIDPATGPTGIKICPQSPTGFTTSQRGLAYDPAADTWFAGGWNDTMVYRFGSDGTILSSKNTGIAISGLAYNPETDHLFVMENAPGSRVFVLDVANNYNTVGQFTISGFTAYSGVGLEFDCDGNLWAPDANTGTIYQVDSGETAALCGQDVAWLTESPTSGTVPAGGSVTVNVTLDSATVDPGVYNAQLKFKTNTPYTVPNLPVTMRVTVPPTWGKLNGTVETNGYCDDNPEPLAGVTVEVNSAGFTEPLLLTTNADGYYSAWLDQSYSPLTVSVNVPGYEFGQATGVMLNGGTSTRQDFSLRLLQPCMRVTPTSVSVQLDLGQTTSRYVRLINDGAAQADFEMTESSRGYVPPATVEKTEGAGTLSHLANPPQAVEGQQSLPARPDDSVTITESNSQVVMSGNSVSCNAGGLHTDNSYLRVFNLPDFGIADDFNVTSVDVGVELASASGATQPAVVNLYTLEGPLLWANLTEIGTAPVNISNQSLTILNVPVSGLAPAGSQLVVELFTPSGQAAGNSFFVGSNNLGETAPSYLSAVDCGVPEPTATGAIGFPGMNIVMNVTGELGGAGGDVAWLSESPATGSVAADSYLWTVFSFDSTQVAAPGTYRAAVKVNSNDPVNPARTVNVSMRITAPATWGVLEGTITDMGYCDANPAPLAGATVDILGSNGLTRSVTSDTNGHYLVWLPENGSPYTVTASHPDFLGASASGIVVTGMGTTTQDLSLRWLAPCLGVTPDALNVTVPWAGSTSENLTLTNQGAASSLFTITEQTGGFTPMAPVNKVLVVNDGGGNTSAANAFTTALNNLGILYDVVSSSSSTGITPPGGNALTDYLGVLYAGVPSTGAEINQLMAYLDAGGKLLIADNDFGYTDKTTVLYQTYLEATYVLDAGSDGPIHGVDIEAGVDVDISSDPYPDSFTIGADAVGIFANTAPRVNWAGSRIARNGYKAIYFAWDFYYAGGSAVGDPIETTILQKSLDWLLAADVPWLSEDPTQGSVGADGGVQTVQVDFNANVPAINQPGTYDASLKIANQDTNLGAVIIPVTMLVLPPDTMGKLDGTVTSLGYCDAENNPLNQASVHITSATAQTWDLKTDASGYYQIWVDQVGSPYTVEVTAAGHVGETQAGVGVTGGVTTTVDFGLRWLKPCVSVDPASLSAEVTMGMSTTVQTTVSNTGAAATNFLIGEKDRGFNPNRPEAGEDVLLVDADTTAANAIKGALTALGYTYATTNSTAFGSMSVDQLKAYSVVMYSGYLSSTSTAVTKIKEYLDAGGRFLITDNDFGYYNYANDLYTVYFQAAYGTDAGSDGPITGADLMAGIDTDISSDPYPDNFTITGPDGVALFNNTAPRTGYAGMRIERNGYKAIYLAWDYQYAGGSAAGDPVETTIMAKAMAWLAPGVPWMDEAPTSGTLDADTGSQVIDVTLDASVPEVTQPGIYMATMKVLSDDPVNGYIGVPVTMTVTAPDGWGKLAGTIVSEGYCDAAPAPGAGASVLVDNGTETWNLTADSNGYYQVWMLASNPVTVTVTLAEHEEGQATVAVVGGQTTTQDFSLRWIKPCVSVNPDAFDVQLKLGETTTELLEAINSGAGDASFAIAEAAGTAFAQPVKADPVFGAPHEGARLIAQKALGEPHSVVSSAYTPEGSVNLVVDDGSSENSIGVTDGVSSYQFIWMNRFTPDPTEFPFNLQEITILWPAGQVTAGSAVELVVYQDTDGDGDPSNAELMGTYDVTIQHTDGTTWDVFTLPSPILLGGPGDVLIGAINRWVTSAVSPAQWPANIDTTASQGRSWIGWWTTDPPVPPVLPPDLAWGTIDSQGFAGNWMIRASGNTAPGDVVWLSVSPITGTVAADSTANIDVLFDTTVLTQTGTYAANLFFSSDDPVNNLIQIPVSLTVVDYGVTLEPETAAMEGVPGETVEYTLHVTNNGSVTDTFAFTASGNTWPVTFPAPSITLDAGEGADITVQVAIPAGAYGGDQDVVTVKATSQTDATAFDTSELTTTVAVTSGVVIMPPADAKSGRPRQTIVYQLHMTNTGNVSDTFIMSLEGNHWPTSLSIPASVTLAAGETLDFNARVTIPQNAANGTQDVVTVRATSFADSTKTATSVLTTTVRLNNAVEVSPPEAFAAGAVNTEVAYTLHVSNVGDTLDTFHLTAVGDWAISFSLTSLTLDAGQGVDVTVQVMIPTGMAIGQTGTHIITVASSIDTTSSSSTVLTTTVNGVKLFVPFVRK